MEIVKNTEQFTLERLTHAIRHRINQDDLLHTRHTDVEVFFDSISHNLVAELSVFVASNTTQKHSKTLGYCPATFWDAVKHFLAPDWLIRRWPVRYLEAKFDYVTEIRVCPHDDIAWDECARARVGFLVKRGEENG